MPPLVATFVGLDAVLAVTAGRPVERWLFVAAAVLGLGVAVVSQFGNVPINHRVKSLPPGPVPANWPDPRAAWRAFNLIRTTLAVLALATNAGALLLTR
jgi:uncharacterized membrane protein